MLRGPRPPLLRTDLRMWRSPDVSAAPPPFSPTGPVTEANLPFPALLINMQILIFGRKESDEKRKPPPPFCCRSGATKPSFLRCSLPPERLTPAITSAQARMD